jgi:hypothetical protein
MRDTATVPHERPFTSQSEGMTNTTSIHNATSQALVIDSAGHILGGGETTDVVADAVTYRLVDRGEIVVLAEPEPESKTKRASRQRGVDEKNGD